MTIPNLSLFAINLVITLSTILPYPLAVKNSFTQALIADGIHSLSDLVSDVVVLFVDHPRKAELDGDITAMGDQDIAVTHVKCDGEFAGIGCYDVR